MQLRTDVLLRKEERPEKARYDETITRTRPEREHYLYTCPESKGRACADSAQRSHCTQIMDSGIMPLRFRALYSSPNVSYTIRLANLKRGPRPLNFHLISTQLFTSIVAYRHTIISITKNIEMEGYAQFIHAYSYCVVS